MSGLGGGGGSLHGVLNGRGGDGLLGGNDLLGGGGVLSGLGGGGGSLHDVLGGGGDRLSAEGFVTGVCASPLKMWP